MSLKNKGFQKPELIWSLLIKNCLTYASYRQSITKQYLKELLEIYKIKTINNKNDFEIRGKHSVATECLIIDNPLEDKKDKSYLIVELKRFNDDGTKRINFSNNKVHLFDKELKLYGRFATFEGLNRFISEEIHKLKEGKICIIISSISKDIEQTSIANLHREHIKTLLRKNSNPKICLHCEKTVTTNQSLMIEIDDKDTCEDVGLVHKTCVRPMDRVIGYAQSNPNNYSKHLEKFDFKTWVECICKGQIMMQFLNKGNVNIQTIAWNGNKEYDRTYSYCLRFKLEDGTYSYVYDRGNIHRFNKTNAKKQKKQFSEQILKVQSVNNPLSITSINKSFGCYSALIKTKAENEDILEIINVEKIKYSSRIKEAFGEPKQYYAPLCIIRNQESELTYILRNVVPIISDPLKIDLFIKNWTKLGFEFDQEIELKIIKTDKDFDNTMRTFFADNLIPIINPEFDKDFNLIRGYEINIFEDLLKDTQLNSFTTS